MLELPKDTYNCSQCSHRTDSVFQLNHHVQRDHRNVYAAELFHARFHAIVEPQLFSCICCDYKSYYQFALYEHCKQEHDPSGAGNKGNGTFCEEIERYPCECCRFKSDSSLYFLKHLNLCAREQTRKTDEISEEAEATKSPNLDGSISRSAIRDAELEKSMCNDSSEKIDDFQCNHCSYRSKRKDHLKSHMLKHATNKEINWFQCNDCSYRSEIRQVFDRHVVSKHAAIEDINWFLCIHCSYRGKRKDHLKSHMLKHATNEEINWFQCNDCSYRSKVRDDLKRHAMFKHAAIEDINWFQCNHCSYRAKQKTNLKVHMLIHAADEEIINWFQCNYCSYRAKRKAHLERHMMTHATDEVINWFQCNHCSYRSKHKSHLKRHMVKHATNKEIIR